MLIALDTKKSLARLLEDVPKACAAHKFGVIGTIDLQAKLAEKGVTLGRGCVVFEVCNPHHAKRVIDADAGVSSMLPCRISAYETPAGGVRLTTVKPSAMIQMVSSTPELAAVACEVEAALTAILSDAAR